MIIITEKLRLPLQYNIKMIHRIDSASHEEETQCGNECGERLVYQNRRPNVNKRQEKTNEMRDVVEMFKKKWKTCEKKSCLMTARNVRI